ncbi:MAG: hypothetical protein KatS3mg105_5273 [Gemmatales bacterium]|nr:MAG: hypothetical protein KatS3mg105_5273 [Gemmatales bacterium]
MSDETTITEQPERTFTQAELDRIIAARLAEERKKYEKQIAEDRQKIEAELRAALEQEVEQKAQTIATQRLIEQRINAVATQRNLSERQIAVLKSQQIANPDDVDALAAELFGQPAPPAVTVPPSQPTGAPLFTKSQIQDFTFFQKHKQEILNALAEGRIIEG